MRIMKPLIACAILKYRPTEHLYRSQVLHESALLPLHVGPTLDRQAGKCRPKELPETVAEQPVTVECAASTTQPSACTQPKVGRPLKRWAGKCRLPSPSNMQIPASRPTCSNTTSCSETDMIISRVWKKCMPKYTSVSAPDNMKSELRTKLFELTPSQLHVFEQHFTPDMFNLSLEKKKRGRPSVTRPSTVFDDVRYDGVGHLIQQGSQQRRCQRDLCTSKTNLLLLQMQHHSLPSLLPPIAHSLTL